MAAIIEWMFGWGAQHESPVSVGLLMPIETKQALFLPVVKAKAVAMDAGHKRDASSGVRRAVTSSEKLTRSMDLALEVEQE